MNEILRDAAERLRAAGIESARAEARILWEHANKSPGAFASLLSRRLAHEPIAYIVGRKEFWSLDFEVGPGVLVPRPETETLVEQALCEWPDRSASGRILDLGTGSGCLLVSLLKELPNASGLGIDISQAALQWAQRNVARHGLAERCALTSGSWADAEGHFDLIVCNPPYIPAGELPGLCPDVRDHEPVAALDGGPDGLEAYSALAPVLAGHLEPSGFALLEIGSGQHQLVSRILEAQGLLVARASTDLAGVVRCLLVRPTSRQSFSERGLENGGEAATVRAVGTKGPPAEGIDSLGPVARGGRGGNCRSRLWKTSSDVCNR